MPIWGYIKDAILGSDSTSNAPWPAAEIASLVPNSCNSGIASWKPLSRPWLINSALLSEMVDIAAFRPAASVAAREAFTAPSAPSSAAVSPLSKPNALAPVYAVRPLRRAFLRFWSVTPENRLDAIPAPSGPPKYVPSAVAPREPSPLSRPLKLNASGSPV